MGFRGLSVISLFFFLLVVAAHSNAAQAPAFAYILKSTNPGSVLVINTATAKLVKEVVVGNSPKGVAIDPVDGSHVYVLNNGTNTISTIDAYQNIKVGTDYYVDLNSGIGKCSAIDIAPDASELYISCEAGIEVVDIADIEYTPEIKQIRVVKPLKYSGKGIRVDFDRRIAFSIGTINSGAGVSVIDIDFTNAKTGVQREFTSYKLDWGVMKDTGSTYFGSEGGMAIDTAKQLIYVANNWGNTVSVMKYIASADSYIIENPLGTDVHVTIVRDGAQYSRPRDVILSPDKKYLYVAVFSDSNTGASRVSGQIQVLDVSQAEFGYVQQAITPVTLKNPVDWGTNHAFALSLYPDGSLYVIKDVWGANGDGSGGAGYYGATLTVESLYDSFSGEFEGLRVTEIAPNTNFGIKGVSDMTGHIFIGPPCSLCPYGEAPQAVKAQQIRPMSLDWMVLILLLPLFARRYFLA
ncbi:MAG: YncE family protein [Gammaproteobacteria bacterium]|nr:YncE family protein [Gammaproteobacteria bacterium]MDH5730079.1 YncE family protein [Gammaproteobacteria bacterium]